MSRRLLLIIAIGAAIRLLLAPFTSWSPDLLPWLSRIQDVQHGVPLYQNLTFSYPPLFANVLALISGPATLLSSPLAINVRELQPLSFASADLIAFTVPTPVVTLLVKLPAIVADIALALALGSIAQDIFKSERGARLATMAWMFNPLAIWVCAVHGQFDTIPALLTVLASGQMMRRQWGGTGLSLSLAILFKLYGVILLPLAVAALVADFVRGKGQSGTGPVSWIALRPVVTFCVGLGIPLLLFLPQLAAQQVSTAVFSRVETTQMGSGLNLWFPDTLPRFAVRMAPIAGTYQLVLSALLVLGIAGLLWLTWRRWDTQRERAILEGVMGILALELLTAPQTNPQFIVWLLPFIVLAWALGYGYGIVAILLSVTPVLFFPAMWAGNPLELMLPALSYFSWPTDIHTAVQALASAITTAGPLGSHTSLRLWLMTLVAGAVALEMTLLFLRCGLNLGQNRERLTRQARTA